MVGRGGLHELFHDQQRQSRLDSHQRRKASSHNERRSSSRHGQHQPFEQRNRLPRRIDRKRITSEGYGDTLARAVCSIEKDGLSNEPRNKLSGGPLVHYSSHSTCGERLLSPRPRTLVLRLGNGKTLKWAIRNKFRHRAYTTLSAPSLRLVESRQDPGRFNIQG